MASQLKVDTLTGVTTAGSIVVTGEGNSTTTNLQQGLAKSWVRFNASSGTPATNDSLNASSLTDHATGKHSLVFSNAMGNANYAFSCGGSNVGTDSRFIYNENAAPVAASFRFMTANDSTAARDGTHNSVIIHGDLA